MKFTVNITGSVVTREEFKKPLGGPIDENKKNHKLWTVYFHKFCKFVQLNGFLLYT